MNEHGTLVDYKTGETIRPATREEAVHAQSLADSGDEVGAFLIDRDGEICANDADPVVFGPTRSVYVQS